MQIRTSNEAFVDKKELFSPTLFSKFRFQNKSVNFYNVGFFRNGNQFFVGFSPKNMDNTLFKIGFRKFENIASVVDHIKGNIGMGKGYTVKLIDDVPGLHGIALQKVSSCRNVVKKVLYSDGCSLWDNGWFLRNHFTSLYGEVCSDFDIFGLRFHFHMCNGGYRSQCLSAKAFGMQVEKIVC